MPNDVYTHIGSENTAVLVRDAKLATFNPDTPTGQGTAAAPTVVTPAKGTGTPTRFTTGASAVALAANASRKLAIFQNVGSVDVWLRLGGTASALLGFKLAANASFVDELTTQAWHAFSSGAGALEIVEVV